MSTLKLIDHIMSKDYIKANKVFEKIVSEKAIDKIEETKLKVAKTLLNIKEEEMTDDEKSKREDIVKGMKKNMVSFKKNYGKDAKSVMYATATKRAME